MEWVGWGGGWGVGCVGGGLASQCYTARANRGASPIRHMLQLSARASGSDADGHDLGADPVETADLK
jgi:hypothetical protein